MSLKIMKKNSKFIFLILVILLTLPSIFGLLHKGFPQTDDGNWMVIRFSAFYESLRDGQFPVRFLMRLNNGYGYPVADFLYPLFMYFGVFLHILKISFVDTIKIILGISLISSSVFCFFWLRKIFNNISSLVGSVFYTLIPYHLFDVYRRGSVGEVLSLAIVPFIFWQIERKSFGWISLGICLLILSHNTLAVLFLPVIFLYMVLNIFLTRERKKLLSFYLKTFLIGFGLSAFFWIPAVFDLKCTVFSKVQVSNWNNYFADLNLVGFSTIAVFLFALIAIFINKVRAREYKLAILFFMVGLISIFLATPISTALWNFLPTSFVQFPFRLLSIAIFCVAFLAAYLVSILSGKKRLILIGVIFILISVSIRGYLFPEKYQDYPDSFYSTNQDTTTVKNEYMPMWVKNVPLSMAKTKVENLNGKEQINILESASNKTVFEVTVQSPKTIQINTVYYPGWKATIDGKKTLINYQDNGLIQVEVPQGQHKVIVNFSETSVRIISDIVSLTSILGLILILIL